MNPFLAFAERYEGIDWEYADENGWPIPARVPFHLRVAQELALSIRSVQRRARALPEVIRQRCDGEFCGNDLHARALRLAYTAKAVVCLLVVPEGGWPKDLPPYSATIVAAYDYRKLYAGWEQTFVSVADPWWKNFYFEIYSDGDWLM